MRSKIIFAVCLTMLTSAPMALAVNSTTTTEQEQVSASAEPGNQHQWRGCKGRKGGGKGWHKQGPMARKNDCPNYNSAERVQWREARMAERAQWRAKRAERQANCPYNKQQQ